MWGIGFRLTFIGYIDLFLILFSKREDSTQQNGGTCSLPTDADIVPIAGNKRGSNGWAMTYNQPVSLEYPQFNNCYLN